ncbi:MAG: DNA-processing protein DprA [Acetivibrionales bacterium]|jgi:DNA processing protein|nr:DNA-processing protein DprA [Bacillota bacterium]NLP08478.1 DNA-protecting protein DprA [Clostridiaceae bacterium]HOA55445.1 DNA-processing protein DprA [Clostridiales bacterium]HPZ05577.1 DNA-processing protein DprA [Clostridiales bacterium]HQD31305.1 DNA-processing protein DprA [Clostridiales bacterium]
MKSNVKYWIWLNSLVKVTPRVKYQLLKYFGDPVLVWEADEAELRASGLCTRRTVGHLTDKTARGHAERAFESLKRCDADVITIYDSSYPELLKHIDDPPLALYCRGRLENDSVYIAVVGSRRATWYGLDMAKRLSREMAKHGVTIVSGMARGVDSHAHRGALESGCRTVAVLGCGIDTVYPPENRGLMDEIIKHGAVISEFLPGTEPARYNFPARNRIISGISLGVTVVEAGEKSGSLITADYALEQGREVFAVPGNINSYNSTGTNKLIREGAKIVTGVGDILDELKIGHNSQKSYNDVKKTELMKLSRDEKTIAQRLLNGPVHLDVISRECGMSVQMTSSILLMLELSGFVEQLPGNYYKLVE